jgi:hypothetical protein
MKVGLVAKEVFQTFFSTGLASVGRWIETGN